MSDIDHKTTPTRNCVIGEYFFYFNSNYSKEFSMKKDKSGPRFSGSTLTIVILSVLLVATVAIGITLAYFSSSVGVLGDITLGNPVNISITQGGSAVSSLTFSSDALPGTVYDQEIGVSAPANTSKALIRAKLTISNTQGATTNVEATTTNDWIKHTDNYYYYNGTLSENETISFIKTITIPTSLTNVDANKTFNVDVIVEAIQQANNAANAVWTSAPADWLSEFSPSA